MFNLFWSLSKLFLSEKIKLEKIIKFSLKNALNVYLLSYEDVFNAVNPYLAITFIN